MEEAQIKPGIRFSSDTIAALRSKFMKYCKNDRVHLKEFRSMLGILGLENASFICDRLFDVISQRHEEVHGLEHGI